MKTILLTIFFTFTLIASSTLNIEQNYKLLNAEIDKIAINLTAEEKVSLYYLILSTHEKIITSLTHDKSIITSLEKLEHNTLITFTKIQKENKKINRHQIQKLKKLYLKVSSGGLKLIKENLKNGSRQIIYRDKIIQKDNNSYIIVASVVFLLIGFFIGSFFYKNHSSKKRSIQSLMIVKDLEDERTNLLSEIDSMHINNENLHKEVERLKNLYQDEDETKL